MSRLPLAVFRGMYGFRDGRARLGELPALGFAGAEGPLSDDPADRAAFLDALRSHGLRFVGAIATQGATVDEHLANFRAKLAIMRPAGPVAIRVHGGNDSFSEDETTRFYAEIDRIEQGEGIRCAHETHRARAWYNPWITARTLERFPALRTCLDVSHWVVVMSRLPEPGTHDDSLFMLAAQRAGHVHARCGFPGGAQVNDPRGPENAKYLAAHRRWWDVAYAAMRARGQQPTVCAEYIPYPYMQRQPHSTADVADLEAIVNAMSTAERERERDAALGAATAGARA